MEDVAPTNYVQQLIAVWRLCKRKWSFGELRWFSDRLREAIGSKIGGLICDVEMLKIQGYIESDDELGLQFLYEYKCLLF